MLVEREERRVGGEWRTSTWGEEISLEYGKGIRGYTEAVGPYRVFGSNGPVGWTNKPLAPGPGVILGRKGAYRDVEYSPDPFFVIDTAYYVKPKTNLNMRWLYYAIKHHKLGKIDDGSPIPSTTRDAVYVRKFDVPPLPEQRAIAHILGTLDDKIELNRRMNETLEEMARALFKSWFVDFDPVRAKAALRNHAPPPPLNCRGLSPQGGSDWTVERARAYLDGMDKNIADLFPDSFEDSELGPIPAGWEVRSLGEAVETVKGRSYRRKELTESETALVTLKSFARGGGYRPDGLKSFAGTYSPDQVVHPGEIVIACTDVTQAADVIGRPAIVQAAAYRTLVASLDTLIVRPTRKCMTRTFLYFLAINDEFVAHTYAHTTGTTVLHLAKNAVPSYRFIQPPTRLVQCFEDVAKLLLERIQAAQQESQVLAALRDTLLPKLISGELRVKSMEAETA